MSEHRNPKLLPCKPVGDEVNNDVKRASFSDQQPAAKVNIDSPDRRLLRGVVNNINALEARSRKTLTPKNPPERRLLTGVARNLAALEATSAPKKLPLARPEAARDLDKLAESTESAFKLLLPWCRAKNLSPDLAPISRQAILYVQAIDFSIVASQHGFTIAEEAIGLADAIKESNLDGDVDTEVERQKYLQGMLNLAAEGHKLALGAMEKFRNVRETMFGLIKVAKAGHKAEDLPDKKAHVKILSDLKKGISVLERFATHISEYCAWWNAMEMAQQSQKDMTQRLAIDYNSLRDKIVIKKWKELREAYVNYTDKIRALQDSYPTLFLESRRPDANIEDKPEDSDIGFGLEAASKHGAMAHMPRGEAFLTAFTSAIINGVFAYSHK
ncbi:hypothetical protein B0H34DRAFT_676702 [Crassisporium funariophilum]|nr:hypothetical protein B0H34DRAFT_676702 [Crassisporium funariophilum]